MQHYIDDFNAVGKPESNKRANTLKVFKEACLSLGMPLDPTKEEGPATVVLFLWGGSG